MKGKNAPQHLFSWMNPKLEVRKTSKYGHGNFPVQKGGKKEYRNDTGEGNGVFAKEKIKKGEMLFVMGGYILTIEDENELKGIIADKPLEISEYFSISPRKPSDLAKMPQHYVNHSCNPNAGFKGQIFMVAFKSIEAGSEITFDYAMCMHSNKSSDSYYTFKCECGLRNCRGTITEDDWNKPELQTKYDGYFQYFLQEKINVKKKTK